MSTLVKRIVHRGRENKFRGMRALAAQPITPAITQAWGLLPPLDKGVEDFQRIGDKVQPKSLTLKGTISIDHNANLMSDSVHVRVLVLRVREAQKNTDAITKFAAKAGTLLQTNFGVGNSLAGFTGNVFNTFYGVNTDSFRALKDRVYELNPAFYVAGFPQPSNFRSVKRISMSIPLPSSLMYSDDSNEAQNYAPIICIGYTYPDGRPIEAGEQRVVADIYTKIVYEDA